MEKENKFDKKKYDQQYIKDNYKRIVMNLRPLHLVYYLVLFVYSLRFYTQTMQHLPIFAYISGDLTGPCSIAVIR